MFWHRIEPVFDAIMIFAAVSFQMAIQLYDGKRKKPRKAFTDYPSTY
jgi:hypothetical protein